MSMLCFCCKVSILQLHKDYVYIYMFKSHYTCGLQHGMTQLLSAGLWIGSIGYWTMLAAAIKPYRSANALLA